MEALSAVPFAGVPLYVSDESARVFGSQVGVLYNRLAGGDGLVDAAVGGSDRS